MHLIGASTVVLVERSETSMAIVYA